MVSDDSPSLWEAHPYQMHEGNALIISLGELGWQPTTQLGGNCPPLNLL